MCVCMHTTNINKFLYQDIKWDITRIKYYKTYIYYYILDT